MSKLTSMISLTLASAFFSQQLSAQTVFSSEQWLPVVAKSVSSENINSRATFSSQFHLNVHQLEQLAADKKQFIVELPTPEGRFVKFQLKQSQVMAKELADKYPEIKTFTGYQIDQPQNVGVFDITLHGFHGFFSLSGNKVFIDPIQRGNNENYHSYYRKDAIPLSESALGKRLPPKKITALANERFIANAHQFAKTNNDNTLTTYRIAISTTGEYSAFHGGTKASTLAALVTMLNRINEVYQRDVGVKLELVANNDSIIFTDAAMDPFANTDEDIDANANVINNAIGATNYDIGHVVGTGGGGLAGLGVVCSSFKADGVTGSAAPTSDAFYIDYVAHELGHQFGAEHTFNGGEGGCSGNRAADSAYEPGSASSIMGYAGLCGAQNLQHNSDPYFHVHSIEQMTNLVKTTATCGIAEQIANQAPVIDAGQNYTIPARTPFLLAGTATDNDSNHLTYSWEQFDLGAEAATRADDSIDDGQRPLFRVFSPTDKPSRFFPKLTAILSSAASYGEALPTKTRTMNFKFVVRDNDGNLVSDNMQVNVVSTLQGFSVNQPSTWNTSNPLVQWHTAGSENAPINCSHVSIALSTDSGQNFDRELASNVVNDGEHELILENVRSESARIKISCENNIFFAINAQDFTINGEAVAPTKPVFVSQQSLTMPEDSSLTLTAEVMTFENNQQVDRIEVLAGENYQFAGNVITSQTDFNGQLVVNARAYAGQLVSDNFTLNIAVTPVNDLPTAVDDSITVAQDADATLIDVLSNDSDIESIQLTLASYTYQGTGTVTISNNQISYKPAAGFSGSEQISYIVRDLDNGESTASVAITVTAAPAPPTPTPTLEPAPSKSSGGSISWVLLAFLASTILSRRTLTK